MSLMFNVGFRVDDKELTNSLSKIQNDIKGAFAIKGGMSDELKAATQQAMILEQAMRKATTDKGISYYSLQAELRKAGSSAATLTTTLASGGQQFAASLNAANSALALSNRSVISLNSKIQEMARVMKQSFKFSAAQFAIREVASATREAVRYVKDLNEAVNKIGVVTNKTSTQLKTFTQEAIKGAKELKVAAKEYAEGALIFYQQGLDDEEVKRRNEITIKAAMAAGTSVETMSEQLTAVWNTYGMVGDEQARAASVGAKMAADTASDFADIAEAMQTAASAASQMGVSYNSLAAIIATVRDTTQQSASTIGNAYKTIFSRFEQLKAEGTDGEVTLNRVSAQLDQLGVHVLDNAGELRQLDDVIMELGQGWDQYSQKQQLAIAELVGGTRQYGQFLALMQNFDKYLKELNAAQNETGADTLEQQYEQATQSIEAKAERAAESWHRAFSNIINEDQLKAVYDLSNGAAGVVEGMIKGIGGLPGILQLVTVFLAQKIVPKLVEGAQNARVMAESLTVEGRQKTIKRDYDNQDAAVANKITAIQNGAVDESGNQRALKNEEKQQILNLRLQQEKLKVSRDVAVVNEKINTGLKSATGQYKIDLQYRAQQLKNAHELYQVTKDQIAATEEQLSLQSKNLENTSITNRKRATDLRSQAERLRGENLHLSDTATNGDTEQARAAATAQIEANLQRIAALKGEAVELENQSLTLTELKGTYLDKDGSLINQQGTAIKKNLTLEQQQLKVSYDIANAFKQMAAFKIDPSNFETMKKAVSDVVFEVHKFTDAETLSSEAGQEILKRIQGIAPELVKTDGEMLKFNGTTFEVTKKIRDITDQSKFQPLLQLFSELGMTAGMTVDNITQKIDSLVNLTEDERKALEAMLQAGKGLGGGGNTQAPTLMRTAQAATQLVASVTMATNAVANLIDVLSDSDATAEEKIGSISSMFITMGPSILMCIQPAKDLFTAITVGAGTATAALGVIGIALAVIAAAFSIWKAVRDAQIKKAKEAAEAAKEEADKQVELTEALRDNTEAVKENEEAWRDSLITGEDVEENFENLTTSLIALTESLTEAGAEQEHLNKLMREGLASGDLSAYYDEVEKIQEEQLKATIAAQKNMIDTSLEAVKQEKNSGQNKDSFYMDKYQGYGDSESVYNEDTGLYEQKYKQPVQNIIDKYDAIGENGFDLDLSDAKAFREQYAELQAAKKEMEATMTKDELEQSQLYQGLTDSLEKYAEAYGDVTAAVQETSSNIQTLYKDDIKKLGDYVENTNYSNGITAMQNMAASMREAGLAAGMTEEEIQSMIDTAFSANTQLAQMMALAEKANNIQQSIVNNQNRKAFDNGQEATYKFDSSYNAEVAKTAVQEQRVDKYDSSRIGTWFNGLSKNSEDHLKQIEKDYGIDLTDEIVDKMQREGKKREVAAQEIIKDFYDGLEQEISNEQDELVDLESQISTFIDGLTDTEKELIVKVNTENVESLDEVKDKLEKLKDVELKVKVNYEDQLSTALENRDAFQDIVDDYTENGTLSYDSVAKVLEMGPEYKKFLVETADGWKLSTEAASYYNDNVDDIKESLHELATAETDFSLPFEDLAYSAADLSAMPAWLENGEIEAAAGKISELTQQFYNGEIAKEEFLNGNAETGEVGLIGQLNKISEISSTLNFDQFREITPMIQDISAAISGFTESLGTAYAAGEIGAEEYVSGLNDTKAAALELSEIRVDKLTKQLQDTGLNFNKLTVAEDGTYEITEDLTEEQKELIKELNKTKTAVSTLEKALSQSDVGEAILGTASKYHDKLEEVFDDKTLKFDPDVEVDYTWMDEMNKEIVGRLQEIPNEAKDSLEELVNQASDTVNQINGLQGQEAEAVRLIAADMVQNGVDFDTALNNLGEDFSLSNEQIVKVHTATTAALIETGNLAVNNGMNETLGALQDGEEEAAKFNVKVFVKEFGIDWQDIGFNILGKQFSFKLPLPYLDLGAEAGGALGQIMNKATGNTPEAPAIPDWTDIGGLGGTMPKTPTPTAAGTGAFDDGTGDGGGGGGGGSDPKDLETGKYHERYKDLETELDSLSKAIDRFNKAADDSWGPAKLRNMEKANALLAKQGQTYTKLYKEALAYSIADKKRMQASLSADGLVAKFDETGMISNLEEIQKAWDAKLEAADANKNGKLEESEQKVYEATEEHIEKQKDLLDKYIASVEEMNQAMEDAVNNIREYMNQKAEIINVKLETNLDPLERDIKALELTTELLGKVGVTTGKTISLIGQKVDDIFGSYKEYSSGAASTMAEIDNIQKSLTDPKVMSDYIDKFGPGAWDKYLKENGGVPAELLDQLKDYTESIGDQISDLNGELDDLYSTYAEMFEDFLNRFDEINSRIELNAEKLELYEKIYEASGDKSTDRKAAEADIASAKRNNKEAAYQTAQNKRDTLKEQLARDEKALADFQKQYGTDTSKYDEASAAWYNHLKEMVDNTKDGLQDAESEVVSTLSDVLEAAVEEAEKKTELARAKFVESITNGMFNDIEMMSTYYDDLEQKRKFYVDDYDKDYYLDKFDYQIDDYLKDANIVDPSRMAEWEAFQQRINDLRAEGVELTQAQIDKLQAEFELEKLKDQYEEAQNAKTTMRLTRDASGNYNYVYSSDSSAEDAADIAQKIRDKEKEIRDMGKSIIEEMSNTYLETSKELEAYLAENGGVADEHAMMLKERLDMMAAQIKQQCNEIGIKFSETSLGIISDTEDMDECHQKFTESFITLETAEKEANTEKAKVISDNCDDIGIDYNDLSDDISDATQSIISDDRDAARAAINLKTETSAAMASAAASVTSASQKICSDIRSMIQEYQNLIDKIKEYEALAGQEVSTYDENTDYSSYLYNKWLDFDGSFEEFTEKYRDEINERMMAGAARGVNAGQNFTDAVNKLAEAFEKFGGKNGTAFDNWNYGGGTSNKTASGGLIKTPQVRSLAEEGPELVLNADDTQNILNAVKEVRSTVISRQIALKEAPIPSTTQPQSKETIPVLQDVKIDATFPNVSVADEIEEAFEDLINKTSQYATKK